MIIAKATITFNVMDKVLIPPFSPKVSKIIVVEAVGEELLHSNYNYKPFVVSPIFASGKPIIKSAYNTTPTILLPNKDYNFSITMINSIDSLTKIMNIDKPIQLFNTKIKIKSIELSVKSVSDLWLDANKIKIEFITPTLLQLPAKWSGRKRKSNFLFPVPSLMLWSLIKHWNTYAPEDLRVNNPKKLAVYSNFSMLEYNYNIMPYTTLYDDIRKPIGVLGWVAYEIDKYDDEMDKMLKKILDYASYVGIGRSRSIGFGMVRIISIT